MFRIKHHVYPCYRHGGVRDLLSARLADQATGPAGETQDYQRGQPAPPSGDSFPPGEPAVAAESQTVRETPRPDCVLLLFSVSH